MHVFEQSFKARIYRSKWKNTLSRHIILNRSNDIDEKKKIKNFNLENMEFIAEFSVDAKQLNDIHGRINFHLCD